MARLWALLYVFQAFGSLLTATEAATYPTCRARSLCDLKSCPALPAASATKCSSILSRYDIEEATCASQLTVQTTVTVPFIKTQDALTVSTVYVTSTRVFRNLVTSTVSETSVTTTASTIIPTIFSTITQTIISSTPSIPGQDCTRAPRLKRNVLEIPRDCSCYLTTTLILAPTTSIATSYLPAVTTVRSNGQLVTTTLEVDRTSTQTLTITRIISSTITSIASSTVTSYTTTSVSTTTAYVPLAEICGQPFAFYGTNAFVYQGTIAQSPFISPDATICCSTCYTTPQCANFVWSSLTQQCTIYLTTVGDGCLSEFCPVGRPDGIFGPDLDLTNGYSPGPCGGNIRR